MPDEQRLTVFSVDRDVHKAPALDLVGWFTLTPPSGPQSQHLPIHNQLLEQYNESVLFLAFHPSSIGDGSAKGGKLPLTIYESVYEATSDGNDKQMQDQNEGGPQLVLRFKELPYAVETGEAEMIGVDFVARGGARAGSSNGTVAAAAEGAGKGKKRAAGSDETKDDGQTQTNTNSGYDALSVEEEERIAVLTSKANAIGMLRQRISLLRKYLEAVPPCYLNDAATSSINPDPTISHPILRSIASLLARLPLVAPTTPAPPSVDSNGNADGPKQTAYDALAAAEASDVALVSLLGSLGNMLDSAQSMGSKASVVESRATRNALKGGGFPGQPGGRLQMPMDRGFERDQGIFMDDEDGDSVMDDVGRGAFE